MDAGAMMTLGNIQHLGRSRVREREQREASDTRTDAQRWLGDPPPYRSALAGRTNQAALVSRLRR
jgi:hypothetical protein